MNATTTPWDQLSKALAAATLLAFAPTTFAGESEGFYVWADVTDVRPIVTTQYERTPVTSCRVVRVEPRQREARAVREDRNQNALPALVGGLLGGVIGNQFGSGNGRRAMTVIGAIAGASIASSGSHQDARHDDRRDYRYDTAYETRYDTRSDYRHDNRHDNRRSDREVCETSWEVEQYDVIDGYEVTYRYMGREFERITDEHPGDRMKLYVTVDPIAARTI